MSFPPPIIPQTVEQARQRDQIAGLDPVRLDDPRVELERLRQAIREHRAACAEFGEFGDEAPSRHLALWAHLPDQESA